MRMIRIECYSRRPMNVSTSTLSMPPTPTPTPPTPPMASMAAVTATRDERRVVGRAVIRPPHADAVAHPRRRDPRRACRRRLRSAAGARVREAVAERRRSSSVSSRRPRRRRSSRRHRRLRRARRAHRSRRRACIAAAPTAGARALRRAGAAARGPHPTPVAVAPRWRRSSRRRLRPRRPATASQPRLGRAVPRADRARYPRPSRAWTRPAGCLSASSSTRPAPRRRTSSTGRGFSASRRGRARRGAEGALQALHGERPCRCPAGPTFRSNSNWRNNVNDTTGIGFAHSSPERRLGKSLLAILLVMSIASWAIIAVKGLTLILRKGRSREFLNFFWNASSLDAVAGEISTHGAGDPSRTSPATRCTPRRTTRATVRPSSRKQARERVRDADDQEGLRRGDVAARERPRVSPPSVRPRLSSASSARSGASTTRWWRSA